VNSSRASLEEIVSEAEIASPRRLGQWIKKRVGRADVPVGISGYKLFRLGKVSIKITLKTDSPVVRPAHILGDEWRSGSPTPRAS
jgi:hypothetical protein